MRRFILTLGIVIILGVVATTNALAAPQTQEFIRYMEPGGFDIGLSEDGKWFASHEDAETGATTWISFPNVPEVREVSIIFLTYEPGLDYNNAFWIPLCTILGLFPEELHEDVMNALMVDIPHLQQTTHESAQVRVGEFNLEGGFFTSPGGCLGFMLTITAIGN